ncbi:MAG TPA: S8 family serine peptidase [Acidimicrobiales bacterium]|nr:S8 family serine peptidase [Acidimicrobiales bacterium]
MFALPPLAVTLLVAPGPAAALTPAASTPGTYYAIAQSICAPPKPRHSSCFAMRIVFVKKGTAGASRFELAAGARPSKARSGPAQTIGPAGGLTPADLATAYGFDSTKAVTGQTVAVIDAYNDPTINTDLQTFDSQYGLLPCSETNGCLSVVNQSGGLPLPPDDTSGWSEEESLDVETVHSVCQKCKILLVEANTDANSDLEAAVDEAVALKATEVSNSYGSPEAGSTSTDEAAYDHPGTVITAASGDDGYDEFDLLGSQGAVNQPDEPASFNTVVAVGGTSLYLGQDGTRQSETVFNDNGVQDVWESTLLDIPLGASGGGCSTLVPAKSWQTRLSVWASTGCGSYRLVADIAADADPFTGFDIYDSYDCGSACEPVPDWATVGGTSLASPIIAALFALAGGSHGVAYPALTLYGHLGSSSLYDVTSGGNGYCDGEGAAECGDPNTLGDGVLDCDYPASGTNPSAGDRACDALPGYDGPSGVGTPNGLGAFARTGPTATVSGPKSLVHGKTGKWAAVAKDPFPGGVVTSYTWNWGDGSAPTVTTAATASHDFVKGGVTRTITLTLKDNYGQDGTATYSVKVT